MKDKTRQMAEFEEKEGQTPKEYPPLAELLKRIGGEAERVREKDARYPDSMLAVHKDRATYTFIMEDEVASIHFDRSRAEIFFKGHNIKNLELTPRQIEALEHMKTVLADSPKGNAIISEYCATLARCLADNK